MQLLPRSNESISCGIHSTMLVLLSSRNACVIFLSQCLYYFLSIRIMWHSRPNQVTCRGVPVRNLGRSHLPNTRLAQCYHTIMAPYHASCIPIPLISHASPILLFYHSHAPASLYSIILSCIPIP